MEILLQERIEFEAKKQISRWREKEVARKRKFDRYQKKTGKIGPYRPLPEPSSWSGSSQFNPVHCIKHAKYLAKTIVKKVRAGSYKLEPARRIKIPKANGEWREIDCFGIPDTALCTLLSAALRQRNDKIFSAYSYAYRSGSTPLDAIERLSRFVSAEKVFISKYDFKNYFGSVSHEYIEKNILLSRRFKITNFEKTVLLAAIKHRYVLPNGSIEQRTVGFPQGNSLSLFLANAVGDHLDNSLDKANGNYIRYADDSILINYSYEDSINAISSYSDFTNETKVKVNREKESGISLISDRPSEMRTHFGVSFLGYYVSKNGIHLSNSAKSALKKRCSRIIYHNLIMYPKTHGFIPKNRIDRFGTDWDLLACITEIRLMLYGARTQRTLEGYLNGRSRLKTMSGGISYYCLVGRVDAFAELDGWLIWALKRALNERQKMLSTIHPSLGWVAPTEQELLSGDWLRAHRKFEGRVPSFALAWRASRKAWYSYGNLGVDAGKDIYDNM